MTCSALAVCGAMGYGTGAQAERACHPTLDKEALEEEVFISTNGGAFTDALDKAFFTPFGTECGVKVTVMKSPSRTFQQLRQYVATEFVPFDVASSFGEMEYVMGVREGLFHQLPDGFWDGKKEFMNEGSYSDFGVWGGPYSTVMFYSKERFPDGLKNWADFWDVETYPGPRTLQDHPVNIVIALLASGVPVDDIYPIDDAKLDAAFAKLDELRPHIRTFWKAGDQPVQGVANGEFAAASAWNGRVNAGIAQGYPLEVAWDGNILNRHWFFIMKHARNTKAAEALLYYMQDAELQANFAKIIGYGGSRKDLGSVLEPKLMSALPTSPEHLETGTIMDGDWWADNQAKISEQWSSWVATGSR